MKFVLALVFAGVVFLGFGCKSGPELSMDALNQSKAGEQNASAFGGKGFDDPNGGKPGDWSDINNPNALNGGVGGAYDFLVDPKPWNEKIYFDFNRHEIKKEQRPILDSLAEHLKQNPTMAVVIEGHCDERGSTEYNRALGERRAIAVRTYLADSGIAEDRMFTLSYGSDKPDAPNAQTEEQHGLNRRCQFMIGKKK